MTAGAGERERCVDCEAGCARFTATALPGRVFHVLQSGNLIACPSRADAGDAGWDAMTKASEESSMAFQRQEPDLYPNASSARPSPPASAKPEGEASVYVPTTRDDVRAYLQNIADQDDTLDDPTDAMVDEVWRFCQEVRELGTIMPLAVTAQQRGESYALLRAAAPASGARLDRIAEAIMRAGGCHSLTWAEALEAARAALAGDAGAGEASLLATAIDAKRAWLRAAAAYSDHPDIDATHSLMEALSVEEKAKRLWFAARDAIESYIHDAAVPERPRDGGEKGGEGR